MARSTDPAPSSVPLDLQEDCDLEFKSAKGGLPKSLWETYSAMANTDGGVIVLGVASDGQVTGLADPGRMRQDFWNTVNNRGKISINLLTDGDVAEQPGNGKSVLVIRVPRATRQQRPVYVGQNPLIGTYRRDYEGDYHCSEQEVSRMLADRSDEPADSLILEGFGLDDLDEASVQQYRQRFSARTPTHPWLGEDLTGFLTKLGGWRRDRNSDQEGLTVAGLLMFGRVDVVRLPEAVPGYHVDYREHLSDDPDVRWTDRLHADGTWEANVLQFYLRVVQRLAADLKLPFQLESDLFRRGETIVHEAIREALVNAMIHADYRGEGGIVIDKFRDRFEVSNPGTLLVSHDQLLAGGVSECRNKALQTMFLMIGAAEKAGSGIDKIRQGWRSQHWRDPRIEERDRPSRVLLEMPMVSLMPDEVLDDLKRRFGGEFECLGEQEVQALVTAHAEKQVTNARMREITDQHPAALTQMLQHLAKRGFLVQKGRKRGAMYRLGDVQGSGPDGSPHKTGDSPHKNEGSPHKDGDSPHKPGDSPHEATGSQRDCQGNSPRALHDLAPEVLEDLRRIAAPARQGRRLAPDTTREIVEALCRGRYLTAALIAELMERAAAGLQDRFLKPMVREGLLRLRYPDMPNQPGQAYTSSGDAESGSPLPADDG